MEGANIRPEVVDAIHEKMKSGVGLYQVRLDLLAQGMAVEDVDAHIRFVREEIGPTSPDARPENQESSSTSSGAIGWSVLAACVLLLVGALFAGGGLSKLLGIFAGVLFWSWVMMFGGARFLTGSWLMGLFAYPGATRWSESSVKLFALLALLVGIGNAVLYAAIGPAKPSWQPFIWKDANERKFIGTITGSTYEMNQFESLKECRAWAAAKAATRGFSVYQCGRDCEKKAGDIRYTCAEFK